MSNADEKRHEEEELPDISIDRSLKVKHLHLPLDAFWISVMEVYPDVGKKIHEGITAILNFVPT